MDKFSTPFIIVFLGILALTTQKVYENQISFSKFRANSGWVFLTKMKLDDGQAQISLQTKISGIPFASVQSIDFLIVSNQNWMQQIDKKCSAQHNSTKLTHNLITNGQPTFTSYNLTVPQQQIYYFLFKDCPGFLVKEYSNNKLHLHVKLTILNNNSHLSDDEDEESWLIFPLMLFIGAWLVLRTKQSNPWGDDFDWAKFLLLAAVVTNMSGLFWKAVSYVVYASSGREYAIFDIFYMAMHSLSETIVICLICLIAYGWTINYLYGEDFDLYIPIMTMLGLLNIIVTILNKINDDDHDKYHMYDSVPGYLLVGFRCIIVVVYAIGIILTYRKSIVKKRPFIIEFGILGAINILSLPLLMFYTSKFVSQNNQKQFLFISVELIKSISTILLTYMITSKKSSYAKICYRNLSFLPQTGKFF